MISNPNETPLPNNLSCRGFTLIEIIVVVAIIAVFLVMAFHAFSQSKKTQSISEKLTLQIDAIRASDKLIDHIREGIEVVRPIIPETSPFLVLKDIINQTNVLYLESDEQSSKLSKMQLFKVVSYTTAYGPYDKRNEKVLFGSIKRLTFTCISPNRVQIDLTLSNAQGEFRSITQVGLLNFGGLE
ncbi:prepilin-type N-terminal cleavage/methylation domain-containing protein [bacterium]|nr:prepilin-type N-terminal cleavage/methylation domain-containing protein [bacterium]